VSIAKHHSATHLLQAALRQVLGEHVQQKGSYCDDQRLRFDFSNLEAVKANEIAEVEAIVNQHVLSNTLVTTDLMNIDDAREKGAMALFGEKYDDEVRVLTMGDESFSVELCGGTHVDRTGTIGLIKIVSEQGIASGVRRIEAVAGMAALKLVNGFESSLNKAAKLVKGNKETAVEKIEAALSKQKQLEKEIEALKSKLAAAAGSDLAGSATDVNGVKVLTAQIDGDVKALVELIDQLKNKLGSSVIALASNDGKLAVGVSKDVTAKIKAGDLLKHVGSLCNGKGGGKPDLAKGAAQDLAAIPAALDAVEAFVAEKLA
jgi:alanyl-tRNA synthetase